ncbi:MAG: TIGR03936 family radical SAM-associated protein [Dehalococcoidales bacterium]|nr:TIGR03936 family radical SAM-associated protein [Dehalococcoidales bacterium]
MQRLRIRLSRGQEVKFISHLDIIRLWTRALRRAQIPLAYSEGFSPHPRMSLAAPLPVGVTSEADLMDVFVTGLVSPHWFTNTVSQQLPPGIGILGVYPVALLMPSLQSQVRYAEYRVEVATDQPAQDAAAAVAALLSLEHLPWQHQRDTGVRNYDIRALIDTLWLVDWQPALCTMGMRLRCGSSGSGRPEQVASALGFTQYPQSIHRTKLVLGT